MAEIDCFCENTQRLAGENDVLRQQLKTAVEDLGHLVNTLHPGSTSWTFAKQALSNLNGAKEE